MRAQISRRRNIEVAIPDPVVIHNDSPVKGLKLLVGSNLFIFGLDSGDLKVADKSTFAVLSTERFEEAPVLKIEQVLQAVLIQYKDLLGSIYVCQLPTLRS